MIFFVNVLSSLQHNYTKILNIKIRAESLILGIVGQVSAMQKASKEDDLQRIQGRQMQCN